MSRPKFHTSRQPGPTEAEIALQWEIARLRGELAETRKLLGADDQGVIPGDRLEGESLARFYEKLGRMTRRLLEQWMPQGERCEACGGLGFDAIQTAFFANAKCIRADAEGGHPS